MKEVVKKSKWMAEDGQEFGTAEQCSLYEQICADPLSFFKEHYLFFDCRVENEGFRQKPWHYCNYAVVIKPISLTELKSIERWCKWYGGVDENFISPHLHVGDILVGEHMADAPRRANYNWKHEYLKDLEHDIEYQKEQLGKAVEAYNNYKRIMKGWEKYNERNLQSYRMGSR